MKKNLLFTFLVLTSVIVAHGIVKLHGGYGINVIWAWEFLVLVASHMLVIKRHFEKECDYTQDTIFDIFFIFILMFGFLLNYDIHEKFYYNNIYLIISRTLIIINYYLICRIISIKCRKLSLLIKCIVIEWISVIIIVVIGGVRYESIINNGDNFVRDIKMNPLMQVISFYCLPGKMNFLLGSICCTIIFVNMMIFIKKSNKCENN